MYYYVYDEFVQDPKFERDLALIETRLTDLGISGKIARLALFRDAKNLIRDEVRKGAQTVVAVGNDLTLRRVIDAVEDSGAAIAVIPLGNDDNHIADILGVPHGVEACDVLSARIIEELDVGVVNGERFLNELKISQVIGAQIACDNKFILSPSKKALIEIRNLAVGEDDVRPANPTDGKLEIVIRLPKRGFFRKKGSNSIVPVKKALIKTPKPVQASLDGETFEGSEFRIDVMPNRLRVITGKGRKF